MRTRTYAGIGSRQTPEPVLDLMRRCAGRLEQRGYTLRSGGAAGADSAFEAGCTRHEIFLPWPGFNGKHSKHQGVCDAALALAATVHPNWSRLGPAAQKLMSRNCYQILGEDLRSPVEFVLCWTPDAAESESDRTAATGGTGQAIALASCWNVPVFNLARTDALVRLRDLLTY